MKKFIQIQSYDQIILLNSIHVNNKKNISIQISFIFTDESRNDIYSHQASISNSDVIESASDISGSTSSRSQTPVQILTTNGIHDSGKGNSLLTGTSFDVLMNSLKSMREKDLDFLINNSDDSLIRVTD
jgi:hypothetical protein